MNNNNTPKHISIILDGNRRYAEKLGIPKFKGHEKGFNKIKEVLKWCIELNVKEVTLYCFSTENFERNKNEVDYLFNLFRKKIGDFKKDKDIHDNKVKVSFIGRLSMFPEDMQKAMKEVMEATENYENYKLNLALAYGSRSEIVDAVKKIISKNIKDINEDTIAENLYLSDDVDILIRPGEEKRISNFLLWQSSYAELYFLDTLWPEFTKEDLIKIIEDFKQRERRYGK
ncbi:di-trans,poly-cis-decaprenylcistransferase [Candidatus Woesearchaeota archaeon]|jgi:tritrans,polycis-undecaprenyl-diphosphate synthase [geranylgeranyl-diphosphate specific]|nr:di-trans,poly-cis-decaprenylcistransferase [Candidatus Woesearchaeota archaeon]MDP7244720.1 polyprenyl diphosphate synthase [Flavobacteriales bacterium]|tara:strand:- start:849 stop:1535 length:687 start_codon:yes stop_codon:yes gene_type:complete